MGLLNPRGAAGAGPGPYLESIHPREPHRDHVGRRRLVNAHHVLDVCGTLNTNTVNLTHKTHTETHTGVHHTQPQSTCTSDLYLELLGAQHLPGQARKALHVRAHLHAKGEASNRITLVKFTK